MENGVVISVHACMCVEVDILGRMELKEVSDVCEGLIFCP